MKRSIKRIISVLLCIVMLCTCLPFGAFATTYNDTQSSNPDNLKVGDKIYYGNYPQSKVTDSALISTLTSLAGSTDKWTSYGYYSGTDDSDDGQMTAKDYMKYTDVVYDDDKYRGVYFTLYRPFYTGCTSSTSNSYQDDNGYYINTIYFFKYESLCWRVLDPATGFCMCDYIIDSQAYNNYMFDGVDDTSKSYESYGDSAHTYYASDYVKSSIRKWLNEDFYDTAFSETQKQNIKYTTLNNDSTYSSEYNSAQTTDKIFLLSADEVSNSAYGFAAEETEDAYRRLAGTDYAWCQGLYHTTGASYTFKSNDSNLSGRGTSYWRLRSPYISDFTCGVWYGGGVGGYYGTSNADVGVVPAFKLLNLKSDISKFSKESLKGTDSIITYNETQSTNPDNLKVGDKIYYGNYPQTKVTDSALISTLTSLAGSTNKWTSYGYYNGTGVWGDGKMTAKDYMKYTDVVYDDDKYRGVYFTLYRPFYTGETSSTSNTEQDDNGYKVNTIYFFKYEPLCWRVLDPAIGFCMCDYIIDSQAYNNYFWYGVGNKSTSGKGYGNSAHTYYASDYANSSIRKWLNVDFYDTAFSETQKQNIKYTTLNNDSTYSSEYNSAQTTDKIFLLSYDEAYNSAYGFAAEETEDAYRRLAGTDYAWCQGLYHTTDASYIFESNDNNLSGRSTSHWCLRSPCYSDYTRSVWCDGGVDHDFDTDDTNVGIVPALNLSNLQSEVINKTENVKTTNAVSKKVVEKTTEDTNNNGIKILILSLGIAISVLFVMLIIIRKKIKKQ